MITYTSDKLATYECLMNGGKPHKKGLYDIAHGDKGYKAYYQAELAKTERDFENAVMDKNGNWID